MSALKPFDPTMPRIGGAGEDEVTRRENIEAINSNEFGTQLAVALWGTAPGWSLLGTDENPDMFDADGRLATVIMRYSDGVQLQKIAITYNDVGTGAGQIKEHEFYYGRDDGSGVANVTWVLRGAMKSYYDAAGAMLPETTWRTT